ncbi:DUF58 domain-containing protein [Riemerella columbina]|uniref:DUF58 domain-containing protein n=1 Tax=Riemerella columbina TaxID=103810 RepID=UPI00266E8FED|nr:DUF58 domain-containing protein [Riemerella columbina]WKS96070.1 DUF58 domain-containing protein [Riemerella columbina]
MEVKDIIKKVRQIEIRTKKRTEAALMGQYHSSLKGQGMAFSEVRQYQFGDDVRRIDWNKTARFREPFIKVMEEERELTILLLVDISASMNYGTHTALKKEYAAEICASLGFSAAGNNDKVGLILFADQVYHAIPPQKGRKHILTLLSHILSADDVPAKTNVGAALEYVMNVFKKKSFLFLLSDFNDKINEKTLSIVARKHQLLGISIADEKDMQIPEVGYVHFKDAETGQTIWVNTSNARFRYQYTEEQKQHQQSVKERFQRNSAHFIALPTGADYATVLYHYFQKK